MAGTLLTGLRCATHSIPHAQGRLCHPSLSVSSPIYGGAARRSHKMGVTRWLALL